MGTAIEVQRLQLDELLGVNRNGDRPDAIITDFRDNRVCKNYLLGLCPNTLFTNTTEDEGPCNLVHDERLKRAYEDAARTHDYGYDRDLERVLERIMNHAERKISKGKERVAEEDPSVSAFMVTVDLENAPEVLDIANTIDDKILEMEAAQERGEFDAAGKLSEEVEALRKQKYELQASLLLGSATEEDKRPTGQPNKQKLRVCDVCGAFLSLNDSAERIADHFGGKSHLGFLTIRQKLHFLREWRKTVRASAAGGSVSMGPPPSTDAGRGPGDRYGERRRSPSRERRDGPGLRRDDYRRDDYRRDDGYRRDDRRDYRGGGGGDRRDYRDDRRDYHRDERRDFRDDRRDSRDDRRDYYRERR